MEALTTCYQWIVGGAVDVRSITMYNAGCTMQYDLGTSSAARGVRALAMRPRPT